MSNGRRKEKIWLFFDAIKIKSRKKISAKCKNCGKELGGQAFRMERHLISCAQQDIFKDMSGISSRQSALPFSRINPTTSAFNNSEETKRKRVTENQDSCVVKYTANKKKTVDEQEDEDDEDFVQFQNLPDVILFKIFSYLYIGDLCRAGRVCLRWYHLTRCQVLWKYVDAHDMQLTSYQVQKLVPTLPPCVTYLRICSLSTQHRIPFITPHTAIEIRERCPHLKTLIIESAFIAKHINFTDITVEDLPQKLSVLSLRKSFFHTDQFFCSVSHPTVPKIKVIDCSHCWCVCDNDIPFFSRLSDLQEIYLAGCPISDLGVIPLLRSVPNLKVLDVEHTSVGGGTLMALGQYCRSLEKLYIGCTATNDDDVCHIPKASLPMLQIICLRKTHISCVGLRYLLTNFRTLRYLNVSTRSISTECALELTVHVGMKKRLRFHKYDENGSYEYCDHFLLRKNHLEK